MENIESTFNWVPILINAIITLFFSGIIGGIITYFFNKKIEKMKIKSNKSLQIETFFRDISGEKLENNFSEWSNLFFNMTEINKMKTEILTKKIKKMLTEIFLYGSEGTVKKAVTMQQYTYNCSSENNQINPYIYMYLLAAVICSLKKDFTGYDIDETTLIKMMIKDYTSVESEYNKALVEFKKINNI